MRRKLFCTYGVIILFLSLFIGIFSYEICQNFYAEDYMGRLARESALVGEQMRKDQIWGEGEIQVFVEEVAAKLECRVTVIDLSGQVLGDSEGEASNMENHGDRTEVIMARNGEVGTDKRYSESLKTTFIYAAVPVELDEATVILRLSTPLTQLHVMRSQMILSIVGGIVLAAVAAVLFAYYFAGKMLKPLEELTEAAEEISKGNYAKKIQIETDAPISQLTYSFNKMGQTLQRTIRKLEDENSKLESIVNSMINGVIAVDQDYKILMINHVCRKFFHIEQEDVIGHRFYEVIRNEDVLGLLEDSMSEKIHKNGEIVFQSPLEGTTILRVYTNPITNYHQDHDFLGCLIVFQDITQIRKLEQLRSDFVSNVTHELKTPLTSILGFTDTLKAGAIEDPKAAMRFVDIIDIEAKRLYRLIQDILSLSEIETREEDVNQNPENVAAILEDVLTLLKPQAEEKGLRLITEIDSSLPLFRCNRDRISQVFINIIENAIKYTEKGSVTVRCHKRGKNLVFAVSDTGIGIPKESLNRVFERFYRVDKGRSRKIGGTGLGLSIVKHIVLLYGGKLQVESKEGKGTTFTITLPLENEKTKK